MDFILFPPTWRHRLALKIIWIFPQIRMVALCNSRAMGEADTNSDIDLFIITWRGNLWTARFIVTTITSLLGVRRKNTHGLQKGSAKYIRRTKERYCLSFFITEEHLDLSDIRLKPEDPYLDKWIQTLVPIINKHGILEKFLETNTVQNTKYKIQNKENFFYKNPPLILYSLFFIFSIFESCIKYCWFPRTLRTYERLGRPWGVIISDTMLKFHDQDIRRGFIVTKPHQ